MFALTRKSKAEKTIKNLVKVSRQIEIDQNRITEAYYDLDQTSSHIKLAINAVKGQDLEPLKQMIDCRDVEDEYKAKLKQELDTSQQYAVETLEPLKVAAEKLCANMIVSQNKALQYHTIVSAQTEILRAGKVQFDTLRKLHEEGEELQNEIEQLLIDCEEVNMSGKRELAKRRKSKNNLIDFEENLKQLENPLIKTAGEKSNASSGPKVS